ncbi:unnamed protein product (macronuclear) [Paramecium tetraurelia]|uniref:Uncharacterized protein n=1 Tax=Paramecium tetraurelia TaxID=5888 RepID=A0BN55_PARTE|nr:uncharacterized protein GSPATT00030610001 [Paramecium tetraurelia]CAK59972.1 unnamed protein product [Paramecium tetraurelia]|eukprot:XP_001427370.1 hypothetical protein (macronuclear) [Paramecium tetraurelia strain d4-2]
MEEEETQNLQLRQSDDEENLIPQFKIMSLRDGNHRKVQLQNNNSNNQSDIRQSQQNLIEQNKVTQHYQQANSLLYDLRKEYLETMEKQKNQIVEE